MTILAVILLALLLASTEAKPFTGGHRLNRREDKPPGNLATACTDLRLHDKKVGDEYSNEYSISAMCSGAEVKLDLNKYIKNDNGELAWSKEYVLSPFSSRVPTQKSSISGFRISYFAHTLAGN